MVTDHVRVLMVEDSEDDAALIRRALVKAGMELTWKRVDDEHRFLDALDDPWDVIISDFQMPHFNGLRAFALYQERELDVPFIFVSGAIGEERAVEAMRVGARDYLLKGNLARLAVAVRREIAAAETRAAQRRAEEATRREQRRLAMAVEASGAGVFEHSVPLDDATYCTERCAEILGYRLDEIPTGAALHAFAAGRIHPDDLDALRGAHRSFIAGDTDRFGAELRLRHRDGRWIEAAISATAQHRGVDRGAGHVVGVVLDVSDRRKLEAQLRHAQKMEAVGRLAGGVAHDFNNVLAVILTAGTFVLDALDFEDPAREDMDEVLRAAKRAAELTSQLLAFSRTKPVSPRTVNVNSLLAELDRMLRRLLGEDVRLSVSLAEGLWNVRIDPGSLEQVIANLAVNARDAMPLGGTLTMRTRNLPAGERYGPDTDVDVPHRDYVLISVSDDGQGMDEATRRQIFEPFFTTKQVGQGTGLGLSTCYGIVKQAHGFIWCHSEPGGGTTFDIQLPRALGGVEASEPASTESRTPGVGGESILLVEDDEQLRRTMARLLESLGYAVTALANGHDALQHCAGPDRIDLLLTDIVMPHIGGVELAVEARMLRPGLKVLFMSGYAADHAAYATLGDDELGVLEKPFTPAGVGRRIRQVLDRNGEGRDVADG